MRIRRRVVEKFGRTCFSSGPKILHRNTLVARHPAGLLTRRWLVSHVHFIRYSSAGTFDLFGARDYFFLKTNFPRTDGDVLRRKGMEGRTRGWEEWKIPSFAPLPLFLPVETAMVYDLYGILLSCRQTTGRKILG